MRAGFFIDLCVHRIFILICMLLYAEVYSQHPYFYSISDEKGLHSNEVYDLMQDDFGFVWIGSNSGLYRYDGTDFIRFSTSEQTSKAVSHLTFDSGKKLWCQNFSGQIFSVTADSLKVELDWRKRQANFPVFAFDAAGNIWLSSDSGLYKVNGKGEQHYPPADFITKGSRTTFQDLLFFDDKLYFVEETGIGCISDVGVSLLGSTNRPDLLRRLKVVTSLHSVAGRLLLISRYESKSELWEIRNDSLLWLKDLPPNLGRIFSLHDDNCGRLWIGSTSGALCMTYDLQLQFNGKLLFPGKSVSNVLLDKEGNYWFSTLQDGIFIVPSIEVLVSTRENSGLEDTRIKQLEKDNAENLFIGFQNGKISRYDLLSKQISTVGFKNSPNDIQAMFFDSQTNELMVAQNKTWIVNTERLSAQMVKGMSNIKCFAKLSGNRYLVGAVTGAYELNIEPTIKLNRPLRPNRTRTVFYDSTQQQQWIGYNDGLWVDGKELKWNGESILATEIVQTANGIIWVGTQNRGVLGFENLTQLYHLQNDIPQGFVRKLAAKDNVVWIAAEDKLIRNDVSSDRVVCFTRFDGLPSTEIADIEFFRGKVLLATPKGLVEIPDTLQSTNKVPPSVFIAGFALHERDTILSRKYKLPFSKNNIRITFKGIAFRSHGEFTYKYRLLGLDSAWITTGSTANFARYPSLPAGKYVFEVKALNEDGVESIQPARLTIEILKPFWQQWWFYLLCAIALAGIVALFFIWRIRSLRRKSELEKRMIGSQLATLKAQMNPHFMFNALNSIQDLVLEQDTANAQLYLGKFSELTRLVLDASGEEFISLEKEVVMLKLYLELEQLRFGNDFKYAIETKYTIPLHTIKIPSMIVQPFVENALKHGLLHQHSEKRLSISFHTTNHQLICEIEDNGIGRKAAAEIQARKKQHKSFATKATNERIKLLHDCYAMNIDLQIFDKAENDQAAGTKVVIKLPLIE